MNEEIRKIIIRDEEFLRLFAIVDLNNNSNDDAENLTEEQKQAFKVLSTEDYEFYDYLLNKWKNSNANEMLQKNLEEHKGETFTEEEIKETLEKLEQVADAERGLYYNEINKLGFRLTDAYINKTFYTYYELALRMSFCLVSSLTYFYYFIKKYDKTPLAEALRNFLDLVLTNEATEPYADARLIFKDKQPTKEEFNYFYDSVQLGVAISDIIYYSAKGQDFTKGKKDLYEENYLRGDASYLEDVRTINDNDEDIASSYKLTIMNYVRVARLFDTVDYKLTDFISKTGANFGINPYKELTEEEKADIKRIRTENLAKINTMSLAYFNRSRAFKQEANRNFAKIFSLDATTTKMIEDYINANRIIETRALDVEPSEVLTGEIIEKPLRKSQTRDHRLIEEPSKKETDTNNHVNVSLLNSDLINAHDTLATYNENDLERQEEELKKLKETLKKEQTKKTPNFKKMEALEIDIALKEDQINATNERIDKTKTFITEQENNLNELADYYLSIDTNEKLTDAEKKKEKKKTDKNIKAIKNKIALSKKSLNNRGLYLQLITDFETGKDVLTYAEGDVTLYLENSDQIIKKFTYETKKLLRYIQNQVYYTPLENNDDFILINLDDYVDETGRARSTIKNVRTQLIEAVELLRREGFRVNGSNNKYGLKYTGVISFIDDYFIIEKNDINEETGIKNTTGKRTLAVHLGKTWRTILFSEKKYLEWASIPKVIDRISDKDIDKNEYPRTNANLVQELGHYLYETHRKDLKKTNFRDKTFKMGTLVNKMMQKGVLQTSKSNRYSKRVIAPMQDTLNYLENIQVEVEETNEKGEKIKVMKNLLTYNTNAFIIYDGDEETNDIGLVGSNESLIIKSFEDARVKIHFNVTEEEAYTKIMKKNLKYAEKGRTIKKQKKEQAQKQLDLFS